MKPEREASRSRVRKFRVFMIGTIMLLGFVLLVFYRYIFVTILPGHVGVLYSWLLGGTRVEKTYGEGLAFKLPWNRIFIVETRVKRRDDEVLALSAESMELTVRMSTLYRALPDQAGRLLQELGPDYEERVIRPMAVGAVREAVARFDSTELYTNHFDELESEVFKTMRNSPYAKLIDFQKVVVREVVIPRIVMDAVQDKLAQEQRAASYTFRLEQERQEAERRRIEAIGIQNFYSIVSGALTENLLTWRGIEATVELARSPNSKVVVVGSGKDQLPLILGSDIHNMPPATPVPGVLPENVPMPDLRSMPPLFPRGSDSRGVPQSAPGVATDAAPDTSDAARPPASPPGKASAKAERRTEPPRPSTAGNAQDDQNPPEAAEGLAVVSDDTGLRGEPPDIGFRSLPRNLVLPESTRAPYGAKPE